MTFKLMLLELNLKCRLTFLILAVLMILAQPNHNLFVFVGGFPVYSWCLDCYFLHRKGLKVFLMSKFFALIA